MTTELAVRSTELPEPVARRGITEAQWRTLCHSLFPGADPQSVLMVIDYCAARKLDPMKKPCHIVPMRTKDAKTGNWEWRDVVMPGIYEYRTTAQRTGEYLGHSKPEYGPMVTYLGVTAPEWCEMTMYRSRAAGRAEFPVRRYFAEVVGVTRSKESKTYEVNDRWTKAPIQMLEKCVEAAGLREAFPDEFGGEATAEEFTEDRDIIRVEPVAVQPAQRKSQQQASETGYVVPQGSNSVGGMTAVGPPGLPIVEQRENVGIIVRVSQKDTGTSIALDTGFVCATKTAELITAALALCAKQTRVELVTKAPRDATKYARTLLEIIPETTT